MTERILLTLAILGGTGNEGKGLAYRWAKAGYPVIIGSRTPDKAVKVAQELNQKLGRDVIRGLANKEAAMASDMAVVTVPYAAHGDLLEALRDALQGKVVVDVTVPLRPPKVTRVYVPPAGSAAKEAQQILGEGVRVVAAFQSISHEHLLEEDPIPGHVLVCGDSQQAREQVIKLAAAAGLTGWDAGPLDNAIVVEGLAPILIGINKRYKMKGAGIQVTGRTAEKA
jgi:NADPH-dependent F420 reductase